MERRLEKRKHSHGQSDKKKRKVITLEQKIDVIRRHADGHSNSKISSDISLHEATIRKILKQETVLKERSRAVSSFSSLGAAARKRSIAMIEMESLLSIWIEDCN
ncbi:CENP-B DNA-binding domain protein [Trichuris suis]|nr:CENP-B DNA-binding domain protein [Trichuris suis]